MHKVPFGKAHAGAPTNVHAPAHINAVNQLKNIKRSHDAGRIAFGFGTAGADCVILDISETEARVRIHLDRGALPRNLFLIHMSTWTAYEATVAWDDENKLGLKLHHAHDLKNPANPELRAMSLLCAGY